MFFGKREGQNQSGGSPRHYRRSSCVQQRASDASLHPALDGDLQPAVRLARILRRFKARVNTWLLRVMVQIRESGIKQDGQDEQDKKEKA
jgi:hypothetical protein